MMIERVPSQFQFKQANILVVGDETSLLTLRHTVLERKGHEVVLADSGQKGINLFARTRPLITILDLHLLDLNGLKVLSRLRAIDPPGLRDDSQRKKRRRKLSCRGGRNG
jgi:CheY-like chemotaxis protein